MPRKYDTSIFTRQGIRSAQTRGQIKGFAQGSVATVLVLLLLKVAGWIPAVLLLAAIVVAGFALQRGIRKVRR